MNEIKYIGLQYIFNTVWAIPENNESTLILILLQMKI